MDEDTAQFRPCCTKLNNPPITRQLCISQYPVFGTNLQIFVTIHSRVETRILTALKNNILRNQKKNELMIIRKASDIFTWVINISKIAAKDN